MKTATARDLRQKTAAILDQVRQGQEVMITYRGRRIAVLAPVERAQRGGFTSVGFGIWRNRMEMRSVDKWLRDLRAPRHHP